MKFHLLFYFIYLLVFFKAVTGCDLYPLNSAKKEVVYCQSHSVSRFPQYQKETVRYVKQIFIISTLIECFEIQTEHYENLEYFYEFNNLRMLCSCLDTFKDSMPHVRFNSSCFQHTSPATERTSPQDGSSSNPGSTVKVITTAKYTTNDFNRPSELSTAIEKFLSTQKFTTLFTNWPDDEPTTENISPNDDATTTEIIYTSADDTSNNGASSLTTQLNQPLGSHFYMILGSTSLALLLLLGVGVGAVAFFSRARRARPWGPIYRGGSSRGWRSPLEETDDVHTSLENPFALEMDVIDASAEESEI